MRASVAVLLIVGAALGGCSPVIKLECRGARVGAYEGLVLESFPLQLNLQDGTFCEAAECTDIGWRSFAGQEGEVATLSTTEIKGIRIVRTLHLTGYDYDAVTTFPQGPPTVAKAKCVEK